MHNKTVRLPESPTTERESPLMKVSDYIAAFLVDRGVQDVFAVTGGASMHLNDAFGYQSGLRCIFTHHEQAASMAAEGYARIKGQPAVVNVTAGPGGINAINGVFGAWTDSIPMVVISGQVRRDTTLAFNPVPGLRQLGDQEIDITGMVRGITKYAVLVGDPQSIRYHLEKALHLATTGRQGPVWIDVPIDVQGTRVNPTTLRGYNPADETDAQAGAPLERQCVEILERIRAAERPVLMVGSGVRLAGALAVFKRVIAKLAIPVTTAWTAVDAVPSDSPFYCGRPGTIGDRGGNFAVQNSDLLLVVGCRLAIRQLSYSWASFAREAYKIFVDIDPAEMTKPMILPDLPVQADALAFLEELERQIDAGPWNRSTHADWLAWCKERVARYPVVQPSQRVAPEGRINPYFFLDRLFEHLDSDDVVVCGNATASVVTFQVAKIKEGQRLFANAGCASMGYDLPASIGAAIARGGKRVIAIAGDGSLQMNIQELQTVVHHQLPIKLFVLNNDGYLSCRLTQGNFFKRYAGEGPDSGVSLPDIIKVGQAYGLPTIRIEGADFEKALKSALAIDGPILCDVLLDPGQGFEPKLSARQLPDGRIVSAALEDLAPFLPPEELEQNLLIPRAQE